MAPWHDLKSGGRMFFANEQRHLTVSKNQEAPSADELERKTVSPADAVISVVDGTKAPTGTDDTTDETATTSKKTPAKPKH